MGDEKTKTETKEKKKALSLDELKRRHAKLGDIIAKREGAKKEEPKKEGKGFFAWLFGPLVALLMLTVVSCANQPLEVCGDETLNLPCTAGPGDPPPPELPAACANPSQITAQTCPAGREIVMCQRNVLLAPGQWQRSSEWGCSLTLGGSEPYTAVCVPSCPGIQPVPQCLPFPTRASWFEDTGVWPHPTYGFAGTVTTHQTIIPGALDEDTCTYPDARIEAADWGTFRGGLYLGRTSDPPGSAPYMWAWLESWGWSLGSSSDWSLVIHFE